ncbi:hypothetical protein NA57DRAFT_60499 [Rhizodiscina lignyota]|uniref:BTB domain-containing protein n=1 Tax=Rhizodiscina lignyota TaxID=1504668 RepID=A0A9P4I846_9PEZI|nr:hypothetical protein NA57DRAFT_60499 [Rhizodiscina lignyota]
MGDYSSITTALDLSSNFDDAKYSDLTIRCGEKTFKVHKMILCTQSEFFVNACERGFKESKTNEIDLSDNDVILIEAFLRFMYKGTYEVPQPEGYKVSEICFHLAMIIIGDKYLLQTLKGHAAKRVRLALRTRDFSMNDLLDKAPAVFQSLPKQDLGARESVAYAAAWEYAICLLGEKRGLANADKSTAKLKAAVMKDAAFAGEVVQSLCDMIRDGNMNDAEIFANKVKCPRCKRTERKHILDNRPEDVAEWKCVNCTRRLYQKEWSAIKPADQGSGKAQNAGEDHETLAEE